jgi:hypothetical protein
VCQRLRRSQVWLCKENYGGQEEISEGCKEGEEGKEESQEVAFALLCLPDFALSVHEAVERTSAASAFECVVIRHWLNVDRWTVKRRARFPNRQLAVGSAFGAAIREEPTASRRLGKGWTLQTIPESIGAAHLALEEPIASAFERASSFAVVER